MNSANVSDVTRFFTCRLIDAVMAKLYAAEVAEEVCSAASFRIHGGQEERLGGTSVWRTWGASDVQRILIGRGLSAL
jgi:butyryl-CoA dehydrogenase